MQHKKLIFSMQSNVPETPGPKWWIQLPNTITFIIPLNNLSLTLRNNISADLYKYCYFFLFIIHFFVKLIYLFDFTSFFLLIIITLVFIIFGIFGQKPIDKRLNSGLNIIWMADISKPFYNGFFGKDILVM